MISKRTILPKTVLTALMMLSVSLTAKAELAAPAWNCELQTAKLKGFSLGIGKAVSLARGNGNVHCISIDGAIENNTPVNIHLLGAGVGIGFTYFKELDVKAYAAGVATPNDMFGKLKLEKNISVSILNRGYELGAYAALSQYGVSVGVDFSSFKGIGLEASAEIEGILITPAKPQPEQPAIRTVMSENDESVIVD